MSKLHKQGMYIYRSRAGDFVLYRRTSSITRQILYRADSIQKCKKRGEALMVSTYGGQYHG